MALLLSRPFLSHGLVWSALGRVAECVTLSWPAISAQEMGNKGKGRGGSGMGIISQTCLFGFQQRSTVASMMHRQETVECLRKFNARRKLKVGLKPLGHWPFRIGAFDSVAPACSHGEAPLLLGRGCEGCSYRGTRKLVSLGSGQGPSPEARLPIPKVHLNSQDSLFHRVPSSQPCLSPGTFQVCVPSCTLSLCRGEWARMESGQPGLHSCLRPHLRVDRVLL